MKTNETEIRCIAADVQVRNTDSGEVDGNKLTGYAVKFNDVTTIGGQFNERVSSDAFNGVNMDNTLALWNHNYDEPVGRSGKNLALTTDGEGLRFDIDLPNTTRGNDIAELVRTGIVGGMSFGFTIREDEWDNGGDIPTRTINRIQDLFEITFTPIPAYPTTEVAMRSLEAALTEDVSATIEEEKEPKLKEVSDEVENNTTTEENTTEAADEVVDVNSTDGESVEESEPLATTKEDVMKFLLGL